MPRSPRFLAILSVLLWAPAGPASAAGPHAREVEAAIHRVGLDGEGIRLGIQVMVEGRGVLVSRASNVPRAAASAIKTAVALDLLKSRFAALDDVPRGLDALLLPGVHPAMDGFTPEELSRCRKELTGKTYRDLARIMMGRHPASNQAYNAACNLIMIKLGGPEAITRRLHELDPAFKGIVIDRYMQCWHGDGDNRATPEALVSLYRMTASAQVPGLDRSQVDELRRLLLHGNGADMEVYEKEGTLYPSPMVRVRAGYVERSDGRLVYAVMGEIPDAGNTPSPDLFVRLLSGVDSVAAQCRSLGIPGAR